MLRRVCTFCADPESLARGGPTLTTFFFFLVDEGRDCRTNDGPTFKETKSATMNIFRIFYFLFKSFVKVELSNVFTINVFIRAENCAEK